MDNFILLNIYDFHVQMNPSALSIEPRLTLKWTPTHFEMNPGALFQSWKNQKKNQCLKNQKKKMEKPSILKYIYWFMVKS